MKLQALVGCQYCIQKSIFIDSLLCCWGRVCSAQYDSLSAFTVKQERVRNSIHTPTRNILLSNGSEPRLLILCHGLIVKSVADSQSLIVWCSPVFYWVTLRSFVSIKHVQFVRRIVALRFSLLSPFCLNTRLFGFKCSVPQAWRWLLRPSFGKNSGVSFYEDMSTGIRRLLSFGLIILYDSHKSGSVFLWDSTAIFSPLFLSETSDTALHHWASALVLQAL